jgi:hypothetical protein
VAKICQNTTVGKGSFFRGPSVAQIEMCKTNESLDITWGIFSRNFRSKRYSENFHEFLWCSAKIFFRTATFPNLTSLKLEILLGTMMSTHASVLVDSVGPPSAEVCRTAASFP